MPDAQTTRALIGFAQETTYGGTIPSAPLKTLRFTEESINHNKNAAWSNEIDASGNRVSVIDISGASAGSFTSELSFTDFEPWLRAALRAGAGTTAGGVTTYQNANNLVSFYLEKQFKDIGVFIGGYGLAISEFQLALQANEIAKATFALMGQKLHKETATRGTGAITAASTDAVMRSGADVANLKLDGSAFPCAVNQLNLTVQNNVRAKSEIQSANPTGQNLGTCDVSGTMRTYFPSSALYDKFLASTAAALSFSLSNAAGRFGFGLPSITLTKHDVVAGGINTDVMADISFLASLSGGRTIDLEVEPAP